MSVHRASVVLKPAARRDFRFILLYTEKHWGPARRSAYRSEIDQTLATLSMHPQIGRPRNDIAAGLHSIGVKQHIIFYRLDPGTVTVLRILHRNMDAAMHVDEA